MFVHENMCEIVQISASTHVVSILVREQHIRLALCVPVPVHILSYNKVREKRFSYSLRVKSAASKTTETPEKSSAARVPLVPVCSCDTTDRSDSELY